MLNFFKTEFYLICIFLFVTSITNGQVNKHLITAQELESNKHWFEASVYYERVLYESEDTIVPMSAINGKIRCLKKQSDYAALNKFLSQYQLKVDGDSNKYYLLEQLSLGYYLNSKLEECIRTVDIGKILYPTLFNKNEMLFLKILSLNELNKWQEAREIYRDWLLGINIDSQHLTKVSQVYDKFPHLKNPDKGALLSTLFPGLGQLYAHKPLEAITSGLIQSVGILYGFYNYSDRMYLSALFVGGGIFGSFHFGGSRRAEELVKVYNKKKSTAFNLKIRTIMLELLSK